MPDCGSAVRRWLTGRSGGDSRPGHDTWRETLNANLASADVTLGQQEIDRLAALTELVLEYPMNVVRSFGVGFQQGDTTINGVNSTAFARACERRT